MSGHAGQIIDAHEAGARKFYGDRMATDFCARIGIQYDQSGVLLLYARIEQACQVRQVEESLPITVAAPHEQVADDFAKIRKVVGGTDTQ